MGRSRRRKRIYSPLYFNGSLAGRWIYCKLSEKEVGMFCIPVYTLHYTTGSVIKKMHQQKQKRQRQKTTQQQCDIVLPWHNASISLSTPEKTCLCYDRLGFSVAWIPWCIFVRKQEAFEQEVTQASVWRHALPTPSSTFIFLFLCTTKDRDMLYTDDHPSSSTCTLTLVFPSTPTFVLYLSPLFTVLMSIGISQSVSRGEQ